MNCLQDSTVLALLGGELGSAESEEMERHLDGCDRCRTWVAKVASLARGPGLAMTGPPAGSDSPDSFPDDVGGYRLRKFLGAGAMGMVYEAYDPTLDRNVALKIHAAGGQGGDTDRRLREARALARLSHPNVVTVYQAGIFEDRAFVAMELVDGRTLRQWLAEKERAPREVLGAFFEAGRGLCAVHAAGLVHRDFKPDNVLVGWDGRIRVSDFGVATALCTRESDAAAPAPSGYGGKLAGTPAYMAPEQHAGSPVDARTDQFAFCVALYEALYHERPFVGDSARALADAIQQGPPRDPKSNVRALGFVHPILLRGLSAEPKARYESMGALLRALSGRRRWAGSGAKVGAAALAVLALVLGGYRYRKASATLACGKEGAALAARWQQRQPALERAFLATGAPQAAEVWRGTRRIIDVYVGSHSAMTAQICQAGPPAEEASEKVRAARLDCLGRGARELDALMDSLAQPDATVLAHAVQAGTDMTVSSCADGARSLAEVSAPGSERIEASLAQAKALIALGHAGLGLERAREALPKAHALGRAALEARALRLIESALVHPGAGATAAIREVQAAPQVIAPDASPLGKSYGEWSARWWQWFLSIPFARHPLNGEAPGDCAEGQEGDVWFLGNPVFRGKGVPVRSVTLRCQVPEGTPLFFPVITDEASTIPGDNCGESGEAALRACAEAREQKPRTERVDIDGIPVSELARYRVRSGKFRLRIPSDGIANAVWKEEAPAGTYEAVSYGTFLMVPPLGPGDHFIHVFKESADGFSLDQGGYRSLDVGWQVRVGVRSASAEPYPTPPPR